MPGQMETFNVTFELNDNYVSWLPVTNNIDVTQLWGPVALPDANDSDDATFLIGPSPELTIVKSVVPASITWIIGQEVVHTEDPDHFHLLSYLFDVLVSQLSLLRQLLFLILCLQL